MRSLLLAALVCVLVGACAGSSVPPASPTLAQGMTECTERAAATGTRIARSVPCDVSPDQSREDARRQADAIREDQQRMQLPRPSGTGG